MRRALPISSWARVIGALGANSVSLRPATRSHSSAQATCLAWALPSRSRKGVTSVVFDGHALVMLRIGVLGSGGSAGAGGGADAWPVDPLIAGPSRKRTATQSLPLACTTPTPTRLKRGDMTLSRWAGEFMKAWWRRVASRSGEHPSELQH